MATILIITTALPPVPAWPRTTSANQSPPSQSGATSTTVTFLSIVGNERTLIVRSTVGADNYLPEYQPIIVSSTTYLWQHDKNQVVWTIGVVGDPSPVNGVVLITQSTTASLSASSTVPSVPSEASAVSPTPTTVFNASSTTGNTATSGITTSQAPQSTEKRIHGLSSGAVAGVAIGCLLAGALVAGLILWFCCGKRRTKHGRDTEASTIALMPQEKGPTVIANSLGSKNHTSSPLGSGLPQPLEDDAISGEISKISNSIKNHVKSYYYTGRMNPGLIDTDDIQALGNDLPLSIGTLSTLLENPATREIALRLCIAWVVVSGMQPQNDPLRSFLPLNAGACYQEILNLNIELKPQASSLARWRATTAELLQSTHVRNPFSQTDSRNASIQAALDVLDNILVPFAESRTDSAQRKRNLEEILKRSALFAFTLFSQPSSWEFDWKEQQGSARSGGLCIFPALVEVTNEAGEPVRPPRPFSEAVMQRLDE